MGENEGRRGLKKEEKISITFSLCTLLKPLKVPTKAMIISLQISRLQPTISIYMIQAY